MKLNKAPGIDGLTVEFYRTFWPFLKHFALKGPRKNFVFFSPSSTHFILDLIWAPLALSEYIFDNLFSMTLICLEETLHYNKGKLIKKQSKILELEREYYITLYETKNPDPIKIEEYIEATNIENFI
jgi:hypothetical protein